jgi:hypothetical protein
LRGSCEEGDKKDPLKRLQLKIGNKTLISDKVHGKQTNSLHGPAEPRLGGYHIFFYFFDF